MADSFEDENKIFDQILFQSYVRANQSLERQSKLVNTGNRPFFLENRGDMQYSLGNYDSARYYYNLIIRDTEKYESYDILIAFKKAICEWYLLNNQHFTESFEKFKTIDKKLLTGIEIDYLWVKEKLMRRTAYDSASSVIEKIKDHFVFFNDKVLWMDIQLTYNETISANKMKIGEINLNKVVEHTLEAKDSVMTTLFATRLATYYSIHRKFEKAENIFDQFEGICDNPYVKHVFDFARGYNFKSQGNYQEALKIMTNCLSYSRESGRERDALKLLYHLGTIHYFLNDQQKAIQCYEEAKALQKDYSESQKTAILPVMLAKAFTKSKQFDKALDELDQAIVHCKKYEHIHILAMAYEQKSTTYELLGNNEKALEYSKKYALQLKENQQHSERAKISEILGQAEVKEIIDLNDKLEAENQLKNEQITSQKRQTIIYLLLALLIIGVILAVFRTVYFRNKIFKTQNKLLSNKVDNLVNTLKEKANLIADLEAIGAATPELSEKISTLIKDLRQGRDWVSFMNEFKVLNQRFFERLNEKATTSLTKNDLRMATLIKLDCTLKEIAEISSITYDGAVKAKQRLSKKFDLEAAAKLDDFIKSL